MINYLKILCLFILVAGCGNEEDATYTEYKNIQSINFAETISLNSLDDGKFYNPKFTSNGTKAVFTSENYTGLWYYDFKTKIINQLNPSIGAGSNFEVTESGDKVYFILESTSAKGKTTNYSVAVQNLNSKVMNILFTGQTKLKAPVVLRDGNIAVLVNSEIKVLNVESKKFIDQYDSESLIAFAEGNSILYRIGGNKMNIVPYSDGTINWVEVSANNDKIYFNSSVKGTGVYSIVSKKTEWLEGYKYIDCSPSSNLILFVEYGEFNDEIYVSTEEGGTKFNLTNSLNVNEMYPRWSADGQYIIYNTEEGIIKITKLKINSGNNV